MPKYTIIVLIDYNKTYVILSYNSNDLMHEILLDLIIALNSARSQTLIKFSSTSLDLVDRPVGRETTQIKMLFAHANFTWGKAASMIWHS